MSLDRLYRDVENLKQQYKGLAGGPQLALSSIENGNIDVKDSDGKLVSTVGLQDDGSGATRFFDGPIPPVPSGFTALADGPLIQGTWDGTFQDGVPATYDLAYLEVAATLVEDSGRVSFATITAKEGASATVVADTTGLWAVAVRSVSQAGKKSEFFSAGTVEVKITDLSGAIEAVQDSANGKNKITWSLRAPTSEDPGTIGDTWWVNEARTHEDGSAYLAIIAQYQYQSGGWVQVEMAHEVIASVDLGTATVGELDGIRIRSKTVGTEQLQADFADFMVSRNGTVIAGDNRVRLDNNGFAVFNEAGEPRTQITPEGTTVKGDLEAETLVATGPAEFRSTENRLGQGAKLTLEAGVTDPTAPPIVQPYWKGLEFDVAANETCYGMAWADGKYWTFVDVPPGVDDSAGVDRLISIDPATSDVVDTIPMTDNFWANGGVTAIGSELFLLGPKSGVPYKWFVRVYSTAGVFLREWEYPVGWSATNKLVYKPGIGNNGTDIVIAQCTDAGLLAWYTFSKTTGALLITTVSESTSTSSDIAGIYVGPGDWGGGNRVVVAKTSTRALLTYSTAGVWDSARSWDMVDGSVETGVVFVDGKFRSLKPSGVIHEYAATTMGDSTNDWWATYRWSVDENDDGTNDSTSRLGPAKRFTWPKRSRLRFLGTPLPADVGYITPSIAKKATTPTRTDFRTPPFSVYVGESTAWYDSLPSDWQMGAYPGDVNDFPNATPSTVVSASNTFQVNGDGSGKWGPLTFNADGTMSSSAVPAWVPITSFLNGWAVGSFGFAPAYRVWPDGKVEWRGVMTGPAATTSKPIINIPVNARPSQYVPMGGSCNGSTGSPGWTRIDVNDPTAANVIRLNPQQGSVTWASLDTISYYKN